MKRKIIYSIPAFALTFLICIATLSIFSIRFFKDDVSPETKANIYNFLLKDKQLMKEMGLKISAVPVEDRIGIIKEYYKTREKMDVSEFPDDFQYAWERVRMSDSEWVEYIYHTRTVKRGTKAQQDYIQEHIDSNNKLSNNLISVAKDYEIEFNKDGYLIEK